VVVSERPGLLTRIFRPAYARAQNLAAVDLNSFFAARLGSAGIPDQLTGPEDAFRRIGVVNRAVRVLVGSAAVGLEIVNRKGEPVENREVQDWLDEPYPGMDYSQWVKRILGQIAVTGGSRLLQLDGANNRAWMPVSLNDCSVNGDPQKFPPDGFWYLGQPYPRDRVISIQAPDATQINDSISGIEAASLSTDAGFYSRKHAAGALKSGAFLGALLKYAKTFPSKEKRDEFLNGWADSLKRAKQTGTFPMLEAGGDFTVEKLGLSFVDLALTDLMGMTNREIEMTIGVMPAYMGEDSNSLANFEQQRQMFLESTLNDIWSTVESAFNLGFKLVFKGDVRFRFDRKQCPIAQEIRQKRGLALLPAVKKTMTANEWRKEMGLTEWPPEIGDSIGEADAFTGATPFVIPKPKPAGRAVDAIAEGFRAFLTLPALAKRAEPEPDIEPYGEYCGLCGGQAKRAIVLLDNVRHKGFICQNQHGWLYDGDKRIYTRTADNKPPCNDKLNGRTKGERAIFWRAADREMATNARAYARTFSKLFDGVRDELKASAKDWETTHTLTYDRDALRSQMLAKRKAILPAIWTAGKRSGDDEIAHVAGPRALRTMKRVASMLSPAAMYEIMARAEAWTNLTGNTVYANVSGLIERGVEQGFSLQQMMDALEDFGVGNPENIARTEVLGSLNAGRDDQYRESGVVTGEEWLATMDDRTRDSHAEADGQTVGIDEQFTVGGVKLDYPGDPQAPPEEICQCRCYLLPVVSEE
jgi:hypothetical protein